MKLHYYPETDSLYVEFSEEPGVETRPDEGDRRLATVSAAAILIVPATWYGA